LAKLISPESGVKPLRKLRSYVDQASIPLPRRFESWNYAYREGIASILDPEFGKSIDPESPMEAMETVFRASDTKDLVDRMLAYDWKFTLSDNDLRKVSTMCEHAGIDVAYPMLDMDLVRFSTRVPGRQKLDGQELRKFYKQALADFLPDEIIHKTKHGFGLPFGVWLKTDGPLADLIYTRLDRLKTRGIFQSRFIDQLIDDQKAGNETYFGYFVWDLAMLEEWFTVHDLDI
jgi:asparagine synthase (glutamine-hydrolysing)